MQGAGPLPCGETYHWSVMGDGSSPVFSPIRLNLNLSKKQDWTLCLKSTWGAERQREQRAQGRTWHWRADKDNWVRPTQTIMAGEIWGYLLSISNKGNRWVNIRLFMVGQGLKCIWVKLMCDWEDLLKEREEAMKVFLSLRSSPYLSIFDECLVICFPGQPHLYFYWITPDAQPEPT